MHVIVGHLYMRDKRRPSGGLYCSMSSRDNLTFDDNRLEGQGSGGGRGWTGPGRAAFNDSLCVEEEIFFPSTFFFLFLHTPRLGETN